MPNLDNLGWLAFTSAHYLGLMAAPLLVLLPPARLGKVFWAVLAAMTAGALWQALVWGLLSYEGVFPYVGDLFAARGVYVAIAHGGPILSWSFRLLPTVLGCVCAAALSARAAEQGWRLATRPLVIFSLLQLGALAIAPKYYDRYLLPLVPGALALAAWEHRRPWWKAGLVALVLLGGLSVCLMHDWLSWNAARWDLGRRAVARGIEPGDIQGGFEWDRWYPRTNSCHYRLSLGPSPLRDGEYTVVDTEPFILWFPPRRGAVHLLRLPFDKIGAVAPSEGEESRKKE
jgi:hypothetical protein